MLLALVLCPEMGHATGIEKNADMCALFADWCSRIKGDSSMNTFAMALTKATSIINGDVLTHESALRAILKADVIFMNNALFDHDMGDRYGSLNGKIQCLLEKHAGFMRPNCCIVTTKPLTGTRGK